MIRKKKEPTAGQVDVFGEVHGLDKLVQRPEVLEDDGLKVIHFAISEDDINIPGWLDTVKDIARKMEPEVKSRGRAPWMTAEWQIKRRKQRAGIYEI